MARRTRRRAAGRFLKRAVVVAVVAATLPLIPPATPPAQAATVHEPGFVLEPVFGGATVVGPASIRFAPDRRAFVAERRGRVIVFDDIYDSTSQLVLNIESRVHGGADRGLLGIALDPDFATQPWIYLLYTLDEGTQWPPLDGQGSANPWGAGCPDPPGWTDDGCVVNGELIRIRVNASSQVTSEQTLLTGYWCQQYASHSIGDLAFGADGYLYVSAGDGASFGFADYGQGGGDAETGNRTPNNPCLDPDPTPGGTNPPYAPNPAMTLPDAEGGALRSQDLLSSGDPLSYDGTVLRINPDTGAAAPGNPLGGGDQARIIAHGLRNPYRFTIRPGTNEVWIGDVGWGNWEEINVIESPTAPVENFGWPCYEGAGRMGSYDNLNLTLCESLYGNPNYGGKSTLTAPFYAYGHGSNKPDATGCPGSGAAISGLAFPESTTYPASFDDALVFGDYSYGCTWTMFASGGDPNPGNIDTLVSDLGVVDLRSGPGNELYFSEFASGNVGRFWRLTYPAGNSTPVAVLDADPLSGEEPLTVDFDASSSWDADADQLRYAWDLDNDGQFDDGTGVTAQRTFGSAGSYLVRLRVRDFYGAQSIDTVTIDVGAINDPPVLDPLPNRQIDEQTTLTFTATASDPDVPPDTLTFSLEPGSGTYPLGASIHPTTGVFAWTPSEAQGPGTYRVVIRVTDDGSPPLSDSQQITITVDEANRPPVIDPVPAKSVTEGGTLAFTAAATDPDVPANTLTFSLDDGAGSVPAGATISPTTGAFTWSPTGAQAPGVYDFDVMVSDGEGAGDRTAVTITAVNAAPVPSITAVLSDGLEGSPVSLTATATDAGGDAVTYAWEVTEAGATVATGAGASFAFTPADDGVFTVELTASDGFDEGVTSQDVAIDNVAPTVAVGADAYLVPGRTVSLAGTISDPGADTIEVTWEIERDGVVVASATANPFAYTPAVGGLHTARLLATDGDGGAGEDSLTLRVLEDVAGSIFVNDILWMFETGITRGCNPPEATRYCGPETLTRGEIAAFLARALDLPPTTTDFFVDDESSIFQNDINRLAAAGITRGCNPPANDRYCPTDVVTRGQIAAMVARALDLAPTTTDFFVDDEFSIFQNDINRLAAAGITRGCNPPANDRYCGENLVTREQFAAFLHRALG